MYVNIYRSAVIFWQFSLDSNILEFCSRLESAFSRHHLKVPKLHLNALFFHLHWQLPFVFILLYEFII